MYVLQVYPTDSSLVDVVICQKLSSKAGLLDRLSGKQLQSSLW